MTPAEIVSSPGKLSRSDLRQIRAHLRQTCEQHDSPHAYMFANDGESLVELRVQDGKFTRTPVDPDGRPTGPAKRPLLLP